MQVTTLWSSGTNCILDVSMADLMPNLPIPELYENVGPVPKAEAISKHAISKL